MNCIMLSNIYGGMNMITNAIGCEAVARNILKGFYFRDVLGLARWFVLYATQAKISCSWVNLIVIFHQA